MATPAAVVRAVATPAAAVAPAGATAAAAAAAVVPAAAAFALAVSSALVLARAAFWIQEEATPCHRRHWRHRQTPGQRQRLSY